MKIEIEISHDVFLEAQALSAQFNNEPLKATLERMLEEWAYVNKMGREHFDDLEIEDEQSGDTPEGDELDEPRML